MAGDQSVRRQERKEMQERNKEVCNTVYTQEHLLRAINTAGQECINTDIRALCMEMLCARK